MQLLINQPTNQSINQSLINQYSVNHFTNSLIYSIYVAPFAYIYPGGVLAQHWHNKFQALTRYFCGVSSQMEPQIQSEFIPCKLFNHSQGL